MPTYKAIPASAKKTEELPFYRPIDRWITAAWEKKEVLTPFAVAAVIALVALAGFKFYGSRYESKAAILMNSGQLEPAVREYPRSAAARLARMKLGQKALEAKDYDKAVSWYGPVAESASTPAILKVAAAQNLALAHLKKGDATKAAEILEKSSKDPTNLSADYTRLLLARTQEIKGDKAAAKSVYQSLAEGATEATVKDEAKERLTWMEKGK